ncbi:MerR family transcriptional regulator [Helicobacter cholecystus]|uniref:MerR family transcriptional regulator n=1 Tax=Helicobacter cholecystus TaxID=45498 RepID=A0A3D8IWI2_9HELI|nr:MerR family transcriptional regulator [Helicobacter cholecystus]RDU68931.1 MerR family transcriptional regulator [Helicobacter cholecystus]VEJ25926.1 MerR family transcription regulator [Helicobacter cholecystus]
MSYTILQAEHKSGIPSRKIRFWLDKGLFPHIYKDKNGVRFFSAKDIDWLCWINLYRELGMSIKELKYYRDLCDKGDETLKERLKMIQEQKKKNLAQIIKAQENVLMLEYKEKFYEDILKNGRKAIYAGFNECKAAMKKYKG